MDASRQFYRQSVSQVRMPPLPPSSSAAVGSQIQSHIVAAANDSGSSVNPTFEVNNVENPVQNILNLTGPGVSAPAQAPARSRSVRPRLPRFRPVAHPSHPARSGRARLRWRPRSPFSASRATVPCVSGSDLDYGRVDGRFEPTEYDSCNARDAAWLYLRFVFADERAVHPLGSEPLCVNLTLRKLQISIVPLRI